jgi:pilus assembly protein CpaF
MLPHKSLVDKSSANYFQIGAFSNRKVRFRVSQILEKLSLAVRDQAFLKNRVESTSLNDALDAEVESLSMGIELDTELELRRLAENRLFGYGKLQPLLDDQSIEEIWINGPESTFIARSGVTSQVDISFGSTELSGLVERMLRDTGRRLDRSSPFVDASLPDGSRLHVVIPDITRRHWSLNIRKFPAKLFSMSDLVEVGALSSRQSRFLVESLLAGANILVSGATQAGKTTLLCALINALDMRERVITVEETFEIRATNQDWVALQTRQPNLEGLGEISLRRLIKEALRMRPSRLVVGEVRAAEALDLLIALNSGLPGLCTIHANSATDALLKLSTLPLLAGQNISAAFVQPTIASCIDLVVHCRLSPDGSRSVSEIHRVMPFSGTLLSEPVQC